MADLQITDLKALVIDDQTLSRMQVSQALRNAGFTRIDQVDSAELGLQKMKEGAYDVIFIDWYIPPGMSGYQLLQKIREDRAFDAVACIMVSAESGKHFVGEAMKGGATGYIVKPMMEGPLKAELEKVLVWLGQRGKTGT